MQLSSEFWTDLTADDRKRLSENSDVMLALADAEAELSRYGVRIACICPVCASVRVTQTCQSYTDKALQAPQAWQAAFHNAAAVFACCCRHDQSDWGHLSDWHLCRPTICKATHAQNVPPQQRRRRSLIAWLSTARVCCYHSDPVCAHTG